MLQYDSRSPVAEAFRTLRTSLQFSMDKSKTKAIMVTSPSPSEGKTLVASNLAISFAQVGEKVLIVDADLRKPRIHRHFALPNRKGLTNALVEALPLAEVVQTSETTGLYAVTSGPVPPNPAELLQSDNMIALLAEARSLYDHVVVDCPPAGSLADASILASRVDGIVLVLVSGETRIDQAQEVKEALERAQGRILGVVLNKVRYSAKEYRYRYYYYSDSDRRHSANAD